jgi:16S rRNA (uracil1498-N3)-methyltransferase
VPNLPTVHKIKTYSGFLKNCHAEQKFICYCGDEFEKQPLKNAIAKGVSEDSSVLILIGPEGDFSAKEVSLAIEHGFQPITLGTTRLRTETAAIVAVHTVSLTLQP